MSLRRVMERLRPRRLAGQIALLILMSIVTFQSIMIVMFHLLDVEGRRHIVDQRDLVAGVIVALDAVPPEGRNALRSDLARAAPYVNITILAEPPEGFGRVGENDDDPDNKTRLLTSLLWRDARAFETPDTLNGAPDGVAVQLRKGGYALVSIAQHEKPQRSVWRWLWEDEPDEPFILTPWARAAFAFLMFTTIFVFWMSDAIMAPLNNLAKSAEGFPGDVRGGPLVERGPQEVRELTRSINRMQDRIRGMIAERAHVLAAVSHDLRTIITRLKLKADFIANAELQAKILRDIDLMDGMLHKNLQYLRAEKEDRADLSRIDLDSVLQTVTDEFCDLGHDIRYLGGRREMVFGSISDLQRVFTNLVENAVHHAKTVEISIGQISGGLVQVDVADDGPGIPDEDKAKAFKPFVRGQPGRAIDKKAGFGLGLSIVQMLVASHGGAVSLHDRLPHGLIVRVTLPPAAEREEAAGEATIG